MISTRVVSLIALALFLGATGVRAADAEPPRLKWRGKGPVCSCTSGMSEDDIRKAWEARFAQPDDAQAAKGDEHHEARDQPKERDR
jgi:hypothetical protein